MKIFYLAWRTCTTGTWSCLLQQNIAHSTGDLSPILSSGLNSSAKETSVKNVTKN